MASSQTRLTIWNAALDMLVETALTSEADDRPVARWLGREYDRVRDSVLASHTWNFAAKREWLAADSTAPEFGWQFRYEVPEDFIRVYYLNQKGKRNYPPIPYEIDGQFILCDYPAPLPLRYVRRETLEGNFDVLFCTALAGRLAAEMAQWLTGKSGHYDRAVAAAKEAIEAARLIDSIQGTAESVYNDEVIDVRYRAAG
jgi:hypothetical protein